MNRDDWILAFAGAMMLFMVFIIYMSLGGLLDALNTIKPLMDENEMLRTNATAHCVSAEWEGFDLVMDRFPELLHFNESNYTYVKKI